MRSNAITFDRFLEDTYSALRASAPPIFNSEAFNAWLKEVGELLASITDDDLQNYWADLYGCLLVVKYGGVHPRVAHMTIMHAITMAMIERVKK